MYVKYHSKCRLCERPFGLSEHFCSARFIDFGFQQIQGAFCTRKSLVPPIRQVRHQVVVCPGCGLIQNQTEIDPDILYSSYFYKSSISNTMKEHLKGIVNEIKRAKSRDKAKVLDIAANDFTLLKNYPSDYEKFAVDPSDISLRASKENKDITLINDCFPVKNLNSFGLNNFDIITTIACFYDANDPIAFAWQVAQILDANGIWICEFAYLVSVLENLSYDGMVFEHAAIYSFDTFNQVLQKAELKAIRVVENNVNGGSLQVWVTHVGNDRYDDWDKKSIIDIKVKEFNFGLHELKIYEDFSKRVAQHKVDLNKKIKDLKIQNKIIHLLGSSTKINTILQYCELGPDVIKAAAERDPEKVGGWTLSGIPMISEEESRKTANVYLVGPYHFKKELLERERDFIMGGGVLLFPLPEITLVDQYNYESCLKS